MTATRRSPSALHDHRPRPLDVAAAVRVTAWLALLWASHAGLSAAATVLPAPPTDLHALATFVGDTDPIITTFAVLRVVALAITWYLVAATVLALAAHVSRWRPLQAIAELVAVPAVRRLVHHLLGAGLAVTIAGGVVPFAGSTIASAAPAAPTAPAMPAAADARGTADVPANVTSSAAVGTATMELIDDAEQRSTPPSTVRMHLVPDEPLPATAATETAPAEPAPPTTIADAAVPSTAPLPAIPPAPDGAPRPEATTTPPDAPTVPPTTAPTSTPTAPSDPVPTGPTTPPAQPTATSSPSSWTIVPGDHLWHVSTATLADAWHRAPSNAEIARYLHDLIELNRDRLAIRDNPDLVFPGQVFALPPVPNP